MHCPTYLKRDQGRGLAYPRRRGDLRRVGGERTLLDSLEEEARALAYKADFSRQCVLSAYDAYITLTI
jgi:hypothetical protein